VTERSISTATHGRYLIVPSPIPGPAPLLIGFHGYGEDAEAQLERLRSIPGSDRWTIVSIQGLHRFYNRRTNEVVASWMTRQNREQAIADNIAYVNACIGAVAAECAPPHIVFAGFSQGVAMAFRAAVTSDFPISGVIAVGGDVPPDVTSMALRKLPAALIARGESDNLYPEEQFRRDEERLRRCSVKVQAITLNAGHEWSADMAVQAAEFLDVCRDISR
jgi:predicted esterase